MDAETKQILNRWQSFEKGDGLKKAGLIARVLWVVGLVLFLFVTLGVVDHLSPILIAIAAAVMGWVIAERNALCHRRAHWPIFKRYLDWKRVQDDLKDDNTNSRSMPKRITQIPFPGGSGRVPTGAMQFENDWPGLFLRGDNAINLRSVIIRLQQGLASHPDPAVATLLSQLGQIADIIERDVKSQKG